MRVDAAVEVTEELQQLGREHEQITEELWRLMLRVAAIEYRQDVLVERLSCIRHGVPVVQS